MSSRYDITTQYGGGEIGSLLPSNNALIALRDVAPVHQHPSIQWLLDLHTKTITEGGEVHHIIPKGVGGHPTDPRNLIRLACDDHFRTHAHLFILFHHWALASALVFMADVENQPPSLKGRKWNRDSAFDILQDQALISAVGLARQTAHNDPERSKKISIGLMKHNYNNNNGRTPKQMEAWEQNRFKGNQKGVKRKPEHVSHLPGNTYAKKTPLEVPLEQWMRERFMFRNRKYRAKKKFNTAESDLVLAKSYVVARPTAQSKEYLRLTEAAVVETKTALDKTIEDLAAQEKTKPAGVETPLLQWNREHKNLYGKNWKAKVKLNTAESNLVYFQSNPSQSSGDVRTPEQIVVETKTALDKTIADLAAHQKAKPGAPPNYDDDKDDKDSFVEDEEEEEEEDEEEPELANDYSDDDLEIVLAKKQQPIIISVDDSKDDEEGTFLQKGQNTASALARFRFGDKESDIAAPVSLKEEE